MEPLHDHNQKTYENICRMYDEGIQRVAVVQPTGSGKSLLMAKLIEDNPDSRFFVLSTSHKINDQFKSKLDEETLKRIDFNIYCNMPNMKQEIMESLQPDYILLDEMHRALAKEWNKGIKCLLEMYPNARVLGLSATPIRYLDRCRNVAEELFGGNLACDMSLSQAILDGILPMARYVCGVYLYEKDTESLNKKIERSCNSEEEKQELLRQVKVLKENLDKGHGVSDIFRKYIVTGSEKFVVFLKNTTHLRIMKPVIEKWFTDAGFSVRTYEVHSKNVDRDKEFKMFKEDTEDGIIKACLSVNMVAEGIHGDIDGVIMLRETISPNMYFQMIGRAFSCGKKTIPLIFDLVANSQFISDAADNFPNELKGEIEKRKRECEKEGKEYEVGFDVDEFIVMDEFMDVVSGFREIEGRLKGSWDLYIKALKQYKEREGDCDVSARHIETVGEIKLKLGNWCQTVRSAKAGKGRRNFTKEMETQLNKEGFIWDVYRYRFENNIKAVSEYYKINGKYPSNKSKDKTLKKLGHLVNREKIEMRGEKYPDWKMKIVLKYLPEFSCETRWDKSFNEFIYYAKLYKDQFGHMQIKENESINSFDIGRRLYTVKKMYKDGRLTIENIKVLEELGICLESKFQKDFNNNMELAKQAVKDGVIIRSSNGIYEEKNLYNWIRNTVKKKYQNKCLSDKEIKIIETLVGMSLKDFYKGCMNIRYKAKFDLCLQAVNEGVILTESNKIYKGVNLVNWIKNHKKQFSDDEMKIINQVMPPCPQNIPVRISDIKNHICKDYISINEAGRALHNEFNAVDSDNKGIKAIRNRLTGIIRNPVYKDRYRFEYVDNKAS